MFSTYLIILKFLITSFFEVGRYTFEGVCWSINNAGLVAWIKKSLLMFLRYVIKVLTNWTLFSAFT